MARIANVCIMYDYDRRRSFSHEGVKAKAPGLNRILLQHLNTCLIREYNRPFKVYRHIVFCPTCMTRLASLHDHVPEWVADIEERVFEEVGVIGLGPFGQFIGKDLALWFDVTGYDIADRQKEATDHGLYWGTLEEAASKEVVILAVPLSSLEGVLRQMSVSVSPETLVMDVCSVKQTPINLMRKYLPAAELLGTHPLFGPQSAKDGWHGHKMAVCPITPPSVKSESLLKFFRNEGLRLIEMSAEEHDREMAVVQGLTHFIARALVECEVQDSELATTAFDRLRKVMEILGEDSWELFATIENGNPFAGEVRQQFIARLAEIERRLQDPAG